MGFIIPNIVDASAKVSKHSQIDKGVFIGKHVVVNAGAVIGQGAIINSGAIVEHDCEIGEFVHIAPGTVLCGGVKSAGIPILVQTVLSNREFILAQIV